MKKRHTVYVLHSEKYDKIYIGRTTNLPERFKSHNELGTKGWTIKFRPWTVIHTEVFDKKAEAIKREKELKFAQGRRWNRATVLDALKNPPILILEEATSGVDNETEAAFQRLLLRISKDRKPSS